MENAPGFLEATKAKIEAAKLKIVTVFMAGSIALTGAGCTNPDEAEPELSAEPTAPATYDAQPGAEALPAVSADAAEATDTNAYGMDIINTTAITVDTESENVEYDWTVNVPPNEEERGEALPGGPSAPVMDILLRPDGTLGYKDHTPDSNEEESKLLRAVEDNKTLLGAAMREGTIDGVYFRIFESDRDTELYGDAPNGEMMFISKDYTTKPAGERNVYYFLPGVAYIDTDVVSKMVGHEAAHAALGQTTPEVPTSPKEEATFIAACNTLRNTALKQMEDSTYDITSQMEELKENSPRKFAPAYNAVIRGLQNGTYDNLPIAGHNNIKGDIAQCSVQDPWSAFTEQVRRKKINGGKLSEELNDPYFEEYVNEMVKEWHEAVTSNTVYKELVESSYFNDNTNPATRDLGHSHENSRELAASTLNLLLRVPYDLGKNVKSLPADQKQAIDSILNANRERIKAYHPDNANFHKYVDDQYDKYVNAAQ